MPNFLRKDLAMWLISLNILALLASVFPWALGKQADSLVPAPAGIHPEWYFMSPFEMLKLLGNMLPGETGEIAGMLLFTLGIVLWILIPFYDTRRNPASAPAPRTTSACCRSFSCCWPPRHWLLDDSVRLRKSERFDGLAHPGFPLWAHRTIHCELQTQLEIARWLEPSFLTIS
jgi:hypothetical protein